MNCVLIKAPANLTGEQLRDTLLLAFETVQVAIPSAGTAPGTHTEGGAQICQLIIDATQAQTESMLQDAGLTQYTIVGMQTFDSPPVVFTAIENGTKQYLNKRYSDPGNTQEIPPEYNWFPVYAGQSEWVGQ